MPTVTASYAVRDPRLMEAAIALHDNQLGIAEPLLKAYLRDDPFDARAIRMLAELAWRIGRAADAEHLLRRSLEIAPTFNAARANLVLVLGRTGRPAEALAMLDPLFEVEPDDIGNFNLKAATLGRLGDFDQAIEIYKQVLDRAPLQHRVWLSYGHMLKTVGRQADGIAAYRKAIELKPDFGEAWWSLANLKTVKFDTEDMAAMQKALAGDVRAEDRFHLDFALGKAMHDGARWDEAFGHYANANALRLKSQPYAAADTTRAVDRAIATFTAEAMAERTGAGCMASDPIFILGMPRAGSTLIEQILASHSAVEGTSELPDLPAVARGLKGYPGSVLAMTAQERTAAGEDYLRRTSVQRRTERPYFIDKLPNNWLFVPFIRLILPNALIIDARRHPLGCCLSNFRQHFARGQAFSYDLADMGHYYADYVRLMAHVDTVAPGAVHRVIYERMVDDTEAEVRKLLAYCGLEFEESCLEFHRTERAVRTASSEQVRQPIYRSATDEWQRYDEFLGPLRAALGPVLKAYPASPATFAPR